MALTRRGLLARVVRAAAGGAALAGCGAFGRPQPRPAPRPSPRPPDPLLPVVAGERSLLAAYDAVLSRHPRLLPRLAAVRADHAAHLQALLDLVGAAPPAPPPAGAAGSTPSAALAGLRAAERAAAATAGAACLRTSRSRSALLGSISACESAHLVLLR